MTQKQQPKQQLINSIVKALKKEKDLIDRVEHLVVRDGLAFIHIRVVKVNDIFKTNIDHIF